MTTGPGQSEADRLGPAYEAGLARAERQERGAFYTPADVAAGVVDLALDGLVLGPADRPTVCDPAVGGAAFLLAAARRLHAAGHPRSIILGELLWGADTDPGAVAVARAALRAWGAEDGADLDPAHVVLGDPLAVGARAWRDAPRGGFAVVVGNPPFLSPLDTAAPRAAAHAEQLRRLAGPSVAPYADTAALFLVTACALARPGGRVAMILPESVLASRDAGPVRRAVCDRAALTGLWWAGEAVFDVGVRVCAPVLEVGARQAPRCRLWRGRGFEPAAASPVDRHQLRDGGSWAPLLAGLRGAPEVSLAAGPTLATMAAATAGFREQFYGVIPYVADEPLPAAGPAMGAGRAPLVTAGLVDPLHCRWGRTPARFGRRRWVAPTVDLAALAEGDAGLAAWAADRRVPKVVVATQTRVVEAVVDEAGGWWPSVPTVAVVPHAGGPDALWAVAAVLSAPAVSAWALRHYGGTALSSDAIKLSARQVLAVPLPAGAAAWRRGARAAADAQHAAEGGDGDGWRAALAAVGRAMTEAYGSSEEVFDWWRDRLPPWR